MYAGVRRMRLINSLDAVETDWRIALPYHLTCIVCRCFVRINIHVDYPRRGAAQDHQHKHNRWSKPSLKPIFLSSSVVRYFYCWRLFFSHVHLELFGYHLLLLYSPYYKLSQLFFAHFGVPHLHCRAIPLRWQLVVLAIKVCMFIWSSKIFPGR